MNSMKPPREEEWSLSQFTRIDQVCDEFERAWTGGSPKSIEQVMAEHPDLPPSLLLYELAQLEFYLRLQKGETIDPLDYQPRFEGHEDTIARAWEGAKSKLPASPVDEDITPSWTSVAPTPDPEFIGRFKIIRRLGRGGFGTVYLGRDLTSGSDFAIKLLHQEFLDSPHRREEFKQDSLIGAKLDHPHLVKSYRVEQDGDRLFIVQAYIEGSNLAKWFVETKPTPEEIVKLLVPVARALAYLHEHQYVHRDLKPENILVDLSGRPYVCDFGLSLHENDQRGRRGEFAGTRAYMSPEQVRREVDLIDGRSDIWSMGVILYHLLGDRLPFGWPPPRRGETDRESYYSDLKYEIQEHHPRPLRHVRPALSRRLEAICFKCLKKSQPDRYQTGDDLAEDLELYLKSFEPPPPPPPPTVIPKGLRSFDEHDKEFFAELVPGPRRSDGLPVSLAFWLNRLVGSGTTRPLDIGVLFGPSGSGKSSLVKAGLLPRLSRDFLPLVIEATPADTEVRLLKAMRAAIPQLPAASSFMEACQWISGRGAGDDRRVLLVIDQFEQWLYSHSDVAQEQLLAGLKYCNGRHLQVLLLVRDDFWMPLSRAMDHLEVPLQEGKNAAAIDLFDRDHARNVLSAFGRGYKRLPTTDKDLSADQQTFLDQAIDGLSEGGRIVCVRLALFADMMKDRAWTTQEFQAVGGAKGVGVAFLEEKFGPSAPAACRPHRRAVPRILEAFLPPTGSDIKGEAQTASDLRKLSGYSDGRAFAELMQLLDGGLRILTPYAPDISFADAHEGSPSNDHVEQAYQLTHDYLVPSIREWVTSEDGRTLPGRAKRRLRERSEDWNSRPEPRRLPSPVEWLLIQLLVPRRNWTVPQRKMMSAASKRLLTRVTMLVAGVALLAAITWEARGRAQAQAHRDALLSAATVEVPEQVELARPVQRWALPEFAEAYQGELAAVTKPKSMSDDQFRSFLNLGLALAATDPAKLSPILDQIGRIPPEDLPTVVKMIGTPPASLIESLGTRLEAALTSGSADVMPLAVLLGALVPSDPRLPQAVPELARRLRDARPGEFAVWRHQLSSLAPILRPELVQLWRAAPPDRSRERAQLAESLAAFGAGDATTLVAAIEDAEPADFAVLVPPLRKLGDGASRALEDRFVEIRRDASAPFLPSDVALPEAAVSQLVEPHSGRLERYGGLALAVPRTKLAELCDQLAKAGYRPRSIRPYQNGKERLAAVTWHRDRREFRVEVDRSAEEFRAAIGEHDQEGFDPVDVAHATANGAASDQAGDEPITWTGVWVRRESGDAEVKMEFDQLSTDRSQQETKYSDDGFRLVSTLERVDSSGAKRYSTIWAKLDLADRERRQKQDFIPSCGAFCEAPTPFGDLFPGALQTDLRVQVSSPVATQVQESTTGDEQQDATEKSQPSDSSSPASSTAATPQFTGVWRFSPKDAATSRLTLHEGPQKLLDNSTRFGEASYVPVVVEPYRMSADKDLVFGVVWQRSMRLPPDSIRDAKRVANLAIASAECGGTGPLDELLATNEPARDALSFLIERLAPSGYPAARLVANLTGATASTAKRAMILALGEYPAAQVPATATSLIRDWAKEEPDPSVHAAASWYCRRIDPLRKGVIPTRTRTTGDTNGPLWYVGEEGHVMVVLPAGEFRIGSPNSERERGTTETQFWMLVPRSHSLSSMPVTIAQYGRFLEDPSVKARLPKLYYNLLVNERNVLNEQAWHVDVPQAGLARLEAMMYCEWLSEKAGLAEDERCYPGIWEAASKWAKAAEPKRPDHAKIPDYRPEAGAISRRGFRLPTEAEFERACRAEGEQARHFGDADELLEAYASFRGNSTGKLQPVGLTKPNKLGFFDMLGNVSQHCYDTYNNARGKPEEGGYRHVDAGTLKDGKPYHLRGGDFDSPPRDLRSARRTSAYHTNNRFTFGFRVARTEE